MAQSATITKEAVLEVQLTTEKINGLAENASKIGAAVGETGQAAGQILNASGELSQQALLLQDEVGKFLPEIATNFTVVGKGYEQRG